MFKKEAYLYDFFHQNKNYKQQANFIRKKYPKAKTVLEIGSGTGLMTKELVKLGFKVTSLEPSPSMRNVTYENRRVGYELLDEKIQYFRTKRFDLVLALYDVLNYVNFDDYEGVKYKISRISKNVISEQWNNRLVYPISYKKVDNYHRLRLGFKLFKKVYLWYIYWGSGFCIEFHKLYIHE